MTARPALHRTLRALAAPAAACVAVAALASPAAAARPDGSTNVRSGQSASVSWVELDPKNLLGLPGNTHVGSFFADRGGFGGFASGQIADFQCAPGQLPGGHGDPGTCTPKGVRFLDGSAGTLTVTDRTATFRGPVVVSNGGHGEPGSVLATVPASITWTSRTDLIRYRATNTYAEAGISYRSRVTGLRSDVSTTRVTGALGRMGFADDTDDVSQGEFQSFTEVSRERIRR